jgi:thiamine transport system substrate-binding protein
MRYLQVMLSAMLPLFFGMATAAAGKPVLTIYTYNSFTSEWGPGPALEQGFEAECGCDIEWVALEDGAALLSRLKIEGADTRADVVLGLDTNLVAEARATGLIGAHGADLSILEMPVAWDDTDFLPYDWGYLAFVYDSEKLPDPPKSLAALADGQARPGILIEDPRTSTPGLGLVMWVREVYGDGAAKAWAGIRPKIVTVTKGWSEAYGLFTSGEAPLVLSYTTSPAYHQIVEKSDRYKALVFPEGNYMQIEVAAVVASSPEAGIGRAFLRYLISLPAQRLIPATNYMYPVRDLGSDLPAQFAALPRPDKSLLLAPEEAARNRDQWIMEWLDALSK